MWFSTTSGTAKDKKVIVINFTFRNRIFTRNRNREKNGTW